MAASGKYLNNFLFIKWWFKGLANTQYARGYSQTGSLS